MPGTGIRWWLKKMVSVLKDSTGEWGKMVQWWGGSEVQSQRRCACTCVGAEARQTPPPGLRTGKSSSSQNIWESAAHLEKQLADPAVASKLPSLSFSQTLMYWTLAPRNRKS